MATKSENAEIAVLQEQMKTVDQKVDDLKLDIRDIASKLEAVTSLHDKVTNLEKEVLQIQKKQSIRLWLYPTMTAVACGIVMPTITYLIIEFFKTH